jgi:hypothetical protein
MRSGAHSDTARPLYQCLLPLACSTCVRTLAAADLAALLNRLSLRTLEAAFAAFLLVVPPFGLF